VKVYTFKRYRIECDSWLIILAYIGGVPIYRRAYVTT
jgi:hypothetical protein